MKGLYVITLLISTAGLAIIDWRLSLAFFHQPKRSAKVLLIALAIFIFWDVLGIQFKIFFIGSEKYLTGIHIGQFPLEEIFFLILLNYCSLLIYLLAKRIQVKKS